MVVTLGVSVVVVCGVLIAVVVSGVVVSVAFLFGRVVVVILGIVV